MRLSSLYECGCDNCRTKINLAADTKGKDFKSVLKAAENAFKYLHEKGGYKAEDINDKPYQKLISETNNVLSEGLRDNVIPPAMLAKMENDTFIFSGLKTHAQLLEASSFLRDEKGQIRSFDSFANEFNKVNEKYNQNYLEAEHSFALRSSQMAANWAATDPDGRYNLQYRTANDDRVRENHRALQDITLPKEDSFWLSYYPPNGWRCRCTAVEVRKSKFEVSDSEKAIQSGEKATSQIGKDGKNKLEIFRFNPGAEQKVFPPKHPYNKVKDAEKVKEVIEKPIEFKQYKLFQFENDYKYQNFTKEDYKAIMGSTRDRNKGYIATTNSFHINGALRNGDELESGDKKTVEILDKLIKNNQLKDNFVLFRNVDYDFVRAQFDFYNPTLSNKALIERMKESGVKSYQDAGFSSVSAFQKVNVFQKRKFQIQIRAKKGTNAFITENAAESEVILGRNQKFNIVDFEEIENDRIRIIVETEID